MVTISTGRMTSNSIMKSTTIPRHRHGSAPGVAPIGDLLLRLSSYSSCLTTTTTTITNQQGRCIMSLAGADVALDSRYFSTLV